MPDAEFIQATGYIMGLANGFVETTERELGEETFARLLEYYWRYFASMDAYITQYSPWKLIAQNQKPKFDLILYTAAEGIRILTALLYPFIPEAASKVWQQLGLGKFKDGKTEKWQPGEYEQLLQWGGLKPGTKLGELGPIFPRADKDAITKMQELEQNNATPPAAPTTAAPTEAVQPQPIPDAATPPPPPAEGGPVPAPSPIITIDDFAKVELRVAQIKVAERIPKADKLLRLEVDLGYETRQILSGIAEHYTPESLIGRKIVIIANLAPRKMRGLESNGMLLAASLGEGDKPVLAGFLEDVPLGARLK
jgi:methionyl-tRNA synthetase